MKDAPVLHAVEHAFFKALAAGARLPGHATARAMGRGLGRLTHRLAGSRRRRALANLALAFPEAPEEQRRRWARQSFENLGAQLVDLLSATRFDAVQLCRRWTLEGWEHLESVGPEGRPALIMGAHLGFWEILPSAIGLYKGGMAIVVRPLDNPRLDREIDRLRLRFGGSTIAKRGAARGMLRTLADGGRASILIDQRPGPGEGVEVPFFGQPALTSPLLARMAMRFELPVLPYFGFPEPGGRYRVVVRPPIPPESDDPVTLTGRYLAAVEREIRETPGLWLWMHDRWKTR
ncbi:MAG: lysophospholipid acyltransferase family protein [Thermoanaerobaculia bacterium]